MREYSGRSYWPAATLFILTICFFWPAFFKDEIFQFRDLFYFHYPLRYYWATLIQNGEMPFLNTALNGGQPILANPNYATFYPPAWLYVLLPFDSAWNLIFAGHVFWAALGMYWLVRLYHCQRLAAFCAAITFAFSGTFLSCLNYSNMAIAGSWLPWVAGTAIQAYYRGGKWSHAATLTLALQFLAGEPTVTLITALLIVTGWLVGIMQADQKRVLVLRGTWIMFLSGLLICIQLIPAILWLQHSARGVGLDPRQSALFWSLHPARLIEILVPDYYGNVMSPLLADYWGGSLSDTGYPYIFRFYCGCVALLTAPLAWTLPRGKAALLISIAGLALALGRWLPGFESAYSFIPFMQFVRYPEKFLLLFTFGLALASALSLNQWMQKVNLRYLLFTFLFWIVPLMIFAMFPFPEKISMIQRGQQIKAVLNALLYLAASACVLLLLFRSTLLPLFRFTLPIFLILNIAPYTIDIAETQRRNEVHAPNPVLKTFPDLLQTQILHRGEEQIDFIFSGGGDPRILLRDSLYPFSGLPLGIRYGATSDIDRMGGLQGWKRQLVIRKRFPESEALRLMRRAGMNAVLSLKPVMNPELNLRGRVAVAGGKNLVFVYNLNPAAKSEVWWDVGDGNLKWSEKAKNHLWIEIEAHQKGSLIIARNAIPGWKCKLDQRSINTGESSEGFLMIHVPEGMHTVNLTFIPPGFYAGAMISFGSLIVFLITLVRVKDVRAIKEIAQPTRNDAGL